MTSRTLEVLVASLLAATTVELWHYFKDPVPPDERSMPWTDPTRVPEAMARECREDGRQLIATKTDGPDWVYDCIEVSRGNIGTRP